MSNNVLYQHGTLALLVPGLLSGTITMKDLLKHGNTGIGTGEGLDGELIILDGTPYQVNSKGEVNVVDGDFKMPFANAHFGDYKLIDNVKINSREELQRKIIDEAKTKNIFFSIKIKGTFSNMKTRAVVKSEPPYQTLSQASKAQSVFEKNQVKGTLISYFSPQLFHGVAVGGFHSHFLSDYHDFGGHILDFDSVDGELSIQKFTNLNQHFPTDNNDYLEHDFDKDSIENDVRNSES